MGKKIYPRAHPVIKVTRDNFLNLSAPISDTYKIPVYSNPLKQKPIKNRIIINLLKVGINPHKIFKVPPINKENYKVFFLPKYSFKKGKINPENIAP